MNEMNQNKSKDLDWTILFSQWHLWSQKDDLCFVIIIIHNVKNNELFSDHHHINIMHTRYQLQSLKAWGLVQSLVYQRNLWVAPLGGQIWIILKTIQFPHVKIQCLFIYHSQLHKRAGRKKKIQEKTWDDSQLAMVCHLNLWNDASRTQECDQMRFTYERRIGRSRQLFSSVSWRPKVQKNNLFSQIYKSASVRNSWDCCCVATSWRKVQTLMTKM